MAVRASASITLSFMVDIQATYRYYLLQSSTAAKPSVPTAFPPDGWSDSEPGYTSGSTNTLYTVDCTVFTDGTFLYTPVSTSSSYEAAKEAYNKAVAAGEAADEAQATAGAAQDSFNELETRVTTAETALLQDSGRIEAIASQVTAVETNVNESISTLTEAVSTKMDAQGVEIIVHEALDDGVNKVVTNTGFTFDDDGMTVRKTGSEIETTITESGMTVRKNGEELLAARSDENVDGVNAKNLHATTHLIVGGRSRFENYGEDRTGCFWIGG